MNNDYKCAHPYPDFITKFIVPAKRYATHDDNGIRKFFFRLVYYNAVNYQSRKVRNENFT